MGGIGVIIYFIKDEVLYIVKYICNKILEIGVFVLLEDNSLYICLDYKM